MTKIILKQAIYMFDAYIYIYQFIILPTGDTTTLMLTLLQGSTINGQ